MAGLAEAAPPLPADSPIHEALETGQRVGCGVVMTVLNGPAEDLIAWETTRRFLVDASSTVRTLKRLGRVACPGGRSGVSGEGRAREPRVRSG